MKYLPTAFAQLQFAWKLYNYALERKLDIRNLDVPITFREGGMMLVLPDRIFENEDDLILATENMLGIAFGAAAITLNRSREEAGIPFPNAIVSESDQFVVLTYQIRNAFAHDIAEPRWEIRNPVFQRKYQFDSVSVDLSNLNGRPFNYRDIGGPDVLFRMREYAETKLWP